MLCVGRLCARKKENPFSVPHLSVSRPVLFADIFDYFSWLKSGILLGGGSSHFLCEIIKFMALLGDV